MNTRYYCFESRITRILWNIHSIYFINSDPEMVEGWCDNLTISYKIWETINLNFGRMQLILNFKGKQELEVQSTFILKSISDMSFWRFSNHHNLLESVFCVSWIFHLKSSLYLCRATDYTIIKVITDNFQRNKFN